MERIALASRWRKQALGIKRPCAHSGCPELVERGHTRCVRHRRYQQFQVNRFRRDKKLNLYTWRWTVTSRKRLMEYPWCAYCGKPADVTDHRIAHRGNVELFWDSDNWQSLCKRCHDRKTMDEKKGPLVGGARTQVVLVCGPPGAGKSTYVRERMKRGDVCLDVDALMIPVCGRPAYDKPPRVVPVVLAMRDAALVCVRARGLEEGNVCWVVACAPALEHRMELGGGDARVVVLETSAGECARRVQCDESRGAGEHMDWWREKINDWWNNYERGDGEEVVVNG